MAPKQRDDHVVVDIKPQISVHSRTGSIFFRHEEGKLSPDGSYSDIHRDEDTDDDVLGSQERHVRFAVAVRKYLIITREEYTDEEWGNCFYTEKEELKSAKKRIKIAARIEAGKKPKGSMTYRGLECSTLAGKSEFDVEVNRCINAVMDEQDRQWYETLNDDQDRIAAISRAVTREGRERALRRGFQDESDAQEVPPDYTYFNDSMTSWTDDDETLFSELTPVTSPRRLKKKLKKRKTARRLDPPGAIVSSDKSESLPLLRQKRKSSRKQRRHGLEQVKRL